MADKEYEPDEEPETEDLQEPSTEKDPGEEPTAPEQNDEEPSHEAVGIGVVEDASAAREDTTEPGSDPGQPSR